MYSPSECDKYPDHILKSQIHVQEIQVTYERNLPEDKLMAINKNKYLKTISIYLFSIYEMNYSINKQGKMEKQTKTNIYYIEIGFPNQLYLSLVPYLRMVFGCNLS